MSAVSHAVKKAKAWFRLNRLVTEPEVIKWTPPEAAIHIGQIVAIEYRSDKFDGRPRIYRHEVTQEREMFLSPNGDTIVIQPGFRVTTRGIEG